MRWFESRWFLAAWIVVLIFSCLALLKWPHRYSNPDILLGSDVIAMAVLGGIVAILVPQTRIPKLGYLSLFVLFGIVGWRLTIQQANDTAQAEDKLRKTLTGIAEEVTGGDSFCYVDIRMWGGVKDAVRAILLQKGRYPLTNVDIQITQLENINAHLGDMAAIQRNFSFPFVRRGSFLKVLSDYSVSANEDARAFNVVVVARNGRFSECIRLHRIDGAWSVAKIVDASYYSGVTGVVLEEVDKNFPIQSLDSDRDWKNKNALPRLTVKDKDE